MCVLKFNMLFLLTMIWFIYFIFHSFFLLWLNCINLYHHTLDSVYAICKAHDLKIGGLLEWHARSHAFINLHMERNYLKLKNIALAYDNLSSFKANHVQSPLEDCCGGPWRMVCIVGIQTEGGIDLCHSSYSWVVHTYKYIPIKTLKAKEVNIFYN